MDCKSKWNRCWWCQAMAWNVVIVVMTTSVIKGPRTPFQKRWNFILGVWMHAPDLHGETGSTVITKHFFLKTSWSCTIDFLTCSLLYGYSGNQVIFSYWYSNYMICRVLYQNLRAQCLPYIEVSELRAFHIKKVLSYAKILQNPVLHHLVSIYSCFMVGNPMSNGPWGCGYIPKHRCFIHSHGILANVPTGLFRVGI